MNSTTAYPTVISSDQRILDVLRTNGFSQHEGWFYPAGDPSRAVVRFQVGDGNYQIWRRRRLTSAWMLIVAADTREFDETAFNRWLSDWPLVQ